MSGKKYILEETNIIVYIFKMARFMDVSTTFLYYLCLLWPLVDKMLETVFVQKSEKNKQTNKQTRKHN